MDLDCLSGWMRELGQGWVAGRPVLAAPHLIADHQLLWILVSKPKPPFWSRLALNENRGDAWYSSLITWFCVAVTSVAKSTKILLVTRCWMAMRAPGFCPFPPSTGSIDSCEMPATFDSRLVTVLLTCVATRACAPSIPGGLGFAACASVVLPRATRLMMSAGGSAGSEAYVVCRWSAGP